MSLQVVIDIECNGLSPDKIFVIVAKDLVTGVLSIFRNPTEDENEKARFLAFHELVRTYVGHNWLGFDWPVISNLLGITDDGIVAKSIDTFTASKLINYPREKHSVESYGEEFELPKIDFSDWSKYSLEMEEYCIRDVEITERIYKKYKRLIDHYSTLPYNPLLLEQEIQYIINEMERNGFAIDITLVNKLHTKVLKELASLDKTIKDVFVPRLKLIREVTPKGTKYGTISLSSIPKVLRENIHEYSIDVPFSYCEWVEFNPDSPKQRLEVLNKAGWQPTEKTDSHRDTERRYNRITRSRKRSKELDLEISETYNKLLKLRVYGWKVNENNLLTLPKSAPEPARLLSKRIMFESRRKTLQEWITLEKEGRIHGSFQAIGAWTHRMAHQKPNMANITNEFDEQGNTKLLGKELRQCWIAPRNRLLVGVDAEGIQLRIFAHYVNEPTLIKALVEGKKNDKSDPHSVNQRILGSVCRTRKAAKRYLYALFLGAGLGKLQQILECSEDAARSAYDRLLSAYPGFKLLKDEVIPADAERGWFLGIDGRRVPIPGDTVSERRHLAMSGYLQNGEAVVIKRAAVIFSPKLVDIDSFLVDIVHDEYQIETPNDFKIALQVAKITDEAIREAGSIYNLNCPMAGSYYNDDHNEYTIGSTWYETH